MGRMRVTHSCSMTFHRMASRRSIRLADRFAISETTWQVRQRTGSTKPPIRIAEYFKVDDSKGSFGRTRTGRLPKKRDMGAVSRSIKTRSDLAKDHRQLCIEHGIPVQSGSALFQVYGHVIWVGEEKRVSGLIWPPSMRSGSITSASAYVERVALVPKAPYLAPCEIG